MGRVVAESSPSVDGYVAGHGVSVERPFGAAGQRLHHWLGFDGSTPAQADRDAVEQACAAAGDRDVVVAGGADVVQQCLAAGLVDEIRLHVVPVLLGGGTRLFERPLAEQVELEPVDVVTTPLATHLTFRFVKAGA